MTRNHTGPGVIVPLRLYPRFLVLTAFTSALSLTGFAQTFNKIFDFQVTNGASPFHTSLVQGLDGNLYGTTAYGGSFSCPPNGGCGTVFSIDADGEISKFYSFDMVDGAFPYGGVIGTGDGTLFGTTYSGGSGGTHGGGTIFEITPAGRLLTIYSFCSQANCADGLSPSSGLLRASDGYFYGTTCNGGLFNNGTVYKISASGVFTSLHSFNGFGDGSCPFGALMEANDGKIYGATGAGAITQNGTIFTLASDGTVATLHKFTGPPLDGSNPNAPLVQGSDGNLYGTTLLGGGCGVFAYTGCGSIFKITPSGDLTTIYSFCLNGTPCIDGQSPGDALVLGSDGNFYGTTAFGGSTVNAGTVFSITPAGLLTTLHSFNNTYKDGKYPFTTLVQATDGKFYGTSEEGGAKGRGTIFSVDLELSPFVKIQPPFGKSGSTLMVLGTGLTGTSEVSFNGTPATFAVVSDTLIRATVPAGAVSGTVTVVTPGGSLPSDLAFRVLR